MALVATAVKRPAIFALRWVSVMMAARRLGATEGRVLEYAHSGQISGDNAAVVGYLAAALGKPAS